MTTGDERRDRARSFDGTLIALTQAGEAAGTPLLVANAVGATFALWERALVDVARERPIVSWDLRGLYGSEAPSSGRFDPAAHAEDALVAVNHYGHDAFAIVAWDTGARIALELAHRNPDRVTALVIVCGGYGYALVRLVRYLEAPSLLPVAAGVAKRLTPFIEGPFRALVARPELGGLIRQSGMIAATADAGALVDTLRAMARCDLRLVLANYEALAGNPGDRLLRRIEAPTLLIAGERDPFTPLRMMKEMARKIPGAELHVYENATHYVPIEYPARLSEDMRKFLAAAAADAD